MAVSRDKSFANLIVNERDGATDNQGNEYFKRGSASYEELMNARNVVKDTLDFPFNNANERKGVGLVFAYGTDGQHHEKFVNSPLYVGNEKENLASLENVKTKEYFLRHLEKFQTSENVLTKTIEKIKMYVNDEKGLGANLDWLTPESLRACLLDPNKKLTFTSEKGTITIDLQADFKFGFFADCINETILM
ncbi:MAG: hypothetical protein LBG52_00895 [Candidatus Peribacteria bacterium]|nr:hypothetical protein [Candidatus Peribacteria bacterium]